jgi:selenocysteine lyase/cysteine desulfurase
MAAAVRTLEAIGTDAVARREALLTERALRRLNRIEGLRIFGDCNAERSGQRLGVISFTLGSLPHRLVSAILSAEFGIGVRNGCFCAHPFLMHLLELSPEGGAQPAQPHGRRRPRPGRRQGELRPLQHPRRGGLPR